MTRSRLTTGPPAEAPNPDGSLAPLGSEQGRRGTRGRPGEDWRDQAACLGEDPELFFPIGNAGPALAQIEEAKSVCHRCAVMDICLTYALQTGQEFGVWGGLSEDERRPFVRRHARNRRAG